MMLFWHLKKKEENFISFTFCDDDLEDSCVLENFKLNVKRLNDMLQSYKLKSAI